MKRKEGKKDVDYYYLTDEELGPYYEDSYPFWISPFCCNLECVHGKPFKSPLHGIMHRDNPYLINGYRKMPSENFIDCLMSIFSIHNETLNIWTHCKKSLVYI